MRVLVCVAIVLGSAVAHADADHPTTDEAIARCKKGELPACAYAGDRLAEAGKLDDAIVYFARGCTPANDDGCVAFGQLYLHGKLGPARQKTAIATSKASCTKGDLRACYLAAQAERGAADVAKPKSVDAANERAFALFERACDGKVGIACNELADAYAYGFGKPQDKAKAKEYWQRSCDLGDHRACLKRQALP